MRLRPARGQATTELALSALVFVVVLLFGIYFGEVPVMMLKVKEAANFSVTHATGSRTHLFNGLNIASATRLLRSTRRAWVARPRPGIGTSTE